MRKICWILIAVLCFTFLPVSAAEAAMINLTFDRNFEEDAAQLTALMESSLSRASIDGSKAVKLSNENNSTAVARLSFEKINNGILTVSQTVRPEDGGETQIRLLSDGRAAALIRFADKKLEARGAKGAVYLRTYQAGKSYRVELKIDISKKTYEVFVNSIKLGGTISCMGDINAVDAVQYTAPGGEKGGVCLDNVLIHIKKQTQGTVAENISNDARGAYYSTYKARYDMYEPPKEGVIPGGKMVGKASASSVGEGYTADSILDSDASTYWRAAPATKPKNNGKSLIFTKTAATDGTQLAAYSFAPVTGNLVVETDVLGADVVQEKAIPYVMDSNNNMAATMLILGSNISIAGTARTYRDIDADTWYNIKLELSVPNQSYNVYINDTLWQQDVPFRVPCPNLAKIQFHMGANSFGQYCVDNLKVYTTSPLGQFKEMLLEEDFENIAEDSEAITGWTISHSTAGRIAVNSYAVPSEHKFSQFVTISGQREIELEGAYLKIPDGVSLKYTISVARSNAVYVPVLERFDKFYSGEQILDFSPVRALHLRVTIQDAIDAFGNTVHAQVAEFGGILKHLTPVENLAYMADVQVSGSAGEAYDIRGINDGIAAEFGSIGEWWAGNEEEKWAELSWDTPQTIDQIIIHDSASLTDHTKKGVLTFSDGSSIEIADIPNSGYPKTIDFEPKTIEKLRFTITEYEGNANLSELQVFGVGEKPEQPVYLEPDKVVTLDPTYRSRWVCINDLDNDGELEYLSARTVALMGDNHYTASLGAQKEDGTMLWTWGDPKIASHSLGADTPTQVYDINRDGNLEVLTCDTQYLYILNAATGEELKRHKLPVSEQYPNDLACDTIVIADISGKGYATDIIVKNRYRDAWAYTEDWQPIWHVCMPGNKKVGHYPEPIDIDNDGRDEIIVGFACIDEDGTMVFDMKQEQYPGRLETGHKDSLEVVNFVLTGDTTGDRIINKKDMELLEKHLSGETVLTGNAFMAADTDGNGKLEENDKNLLTQKLNGELLAFPNKGLPKEEQRFCLDPCGGGANMIMIDGNGDRVWSLDDATHYETVEKADFGLTDHPFELVVTNTALTNGNMSFEIVDLDGNIIESRYGYMRNREFNAINWTGEGTTDYILAPTDNIVFDGHFNVKLKPLMPKRGYDTMGMKSYQTGDKKYTCDMDGDGTTDIAIYAEEGNDSKIYIYYNKNGAKVADAPGRGYNISQY